MPRRTQEALYAEIDLELSWSEEQLPQVERTKHVHALHPYLGKFVPQLVEVFLHRYFRDGDCVYDPFVGSGTTLVEANSHGCHAVGSDISAFNCLLTRVKTSEYVQADLEQGLEHCLAAVDDTDRPTSTPGEWLRAWYAPQALTELLRYRNAIDDLSPAVSDVARIVLTRAARSARLTTHFDLDFPRVPVRDPYHCFKHKRTCRPVTEAAKFLRRYTVDTQRRLASFATVRREDRDVIVLHSDARTVQLGEPPTGVITSPPYPGLIDYHEQHRYAYELLGLEDRRFAEIGAAARGSSRRALDHYVENMALVFGNCARQLAPDAPIVIVVNDSRELYPTILARAGLQLDDRLTRHVNRRTGRRAGEFFEDVLICRVGGS